MENAILIIFDYNPEYHEIYIVPENKLSQEDVKLLDEAHGQRINGNVSLCPLTGDYNAGCDFLLSTITDKENGDPLSPFAERHNEFKPFLVYSSEEKVNQKIKVGETHRITKIISTGFFL